MPGSYPHWDSVWPEDVEGAEPFPVDDTVLLGLESAVASGGESDRVDIALRLTTFSTLRAFSLVFESDDDLLRPAFIFPDFPGPADAWWDQGSWREIRTVTGEHFRMVHSGGDLPVGLSPATYLITGGKLVVTYGISYSGDTRSTAAIS